MKGAFHKLFRIGRSGDLPEDPGSILRWGFSLIVIFIGGSLTWMALAPLDGAIVSEGVVKVRNERIPIQHSKGGVVSALHVRDGVSVKPGDLLLEISEPARLASYESTRYQHVSELARNARLRAEQMMADEVVFPQAVNARADEPGIANIMAQEEMLFMNRREVLLSAENAMRREMALIRQERVQLSERVGMQREAIALANEQLRANENLAAVGFVSKQRMLELKRIHVAELATAGELEADRLRADQRLAELERHIAEQRSRFQEGVAQELKGSDDRLHQLEQQLNALESEVLRDTITSPVEGTVMNMRALSVGTTIGPLQPVMEIVPLDDSMFVEVPVEPRNIRYVHVGGKAEIQVAGWNRRTMPLLSATIDYISADAIRVKDTASAYVVRLKIEKPATKGEVEPLKPGMQTMVYLRMPARTVLDYLVEPVVDSMRAAFREPM